MRIVAGWVVAGNVAAEDFLAGARRDRTQSDTTVAVVAADPRRLPLVLLAFAVHGVAPVAEPSALVPGGREEGGGRVRGGAVRGRRRVGQPTHRRAVSAQEETGQPTGKRGRDRTEPRRLARKSRAAAQQGGEGHAQDAAGVAQRGRLIGAEERSTLPPHGVSCGGGVGREHVGVVSARFASRRGRAEPSRAGSKPPRRSVVRRRRRCRRGARGARRAGRRRGRTVRVHAALAHVVPMFSRRRRLERGARRRERGARARVGCEPHVHLLSSLGVCQPAAKGSPRASLDLQIRFRYRPRRNRKPQPVSLDPTLVVATSRRVENTRNRAPSTLAQQRRARPRRRARPLVGFGR